MGDPAQWLRDIASGASGAAVDGLVPVSGFRSAGLPPEQFAIMEKAEEYGATAVFFEAGRDGRPPIAQAFVYVSDGPVKDPDFALRHKRLWSWGGVPLVYRVTPGLAQLFRCAHKPDFESKGEIVFKPFKRLRLLAQIASDPWWDAERLRNGTLWDDPKVCKKLLSGRLAAQKTLIAEVKRLYEEISRQRVLPAHLRRKLLVLSLLIAYLEERRVLDDAYFDQFLDGASKFFEVLADGPALVNLLDDLEERFNGRVFALSKEDRETLRGSRQLSLFARLVEGKQEPGGQRTLWERYSFADLPIELISHIYQLFVTDASQAVYTPPFLVRLMLGEVLSWDRLDRLQESWDRPDRPQETGQVILDPCCGSGVFLVEAYKRLVLHWRHRHGWVRPDIFTLRNLLDRVRGMDIEEGAVELAAFSLCLALCDALKPDEIRKSVKLFPELQGKTIRSGCFFKAREDGTVPQIVGVVIGNPPFTSSLGTEGAKRAYDRYQEEHGELPDKQLSYLFLHESMEALAAGGVLSMLQQYGFLYNQQSLGFRRRFIERWDVREILDFISVRGLFHKGGADTKVVVVVAEASQPPPDRQILHATFRRSGRADAEQGFDIDYYDLHWLPRQLALTDDGVWRSDLLGGGRVLDFVKRLKKLTTLGEYAANQGWPTPGEGFFEGASGVSRPADHIIGKPLLPSEAIGEDGIDPSAITIAPHKPIERPRSERRFTPPMLLVREHFDLHHGVWTKGYLTYRNKVVGICGEPSETPLVLDIGAWLRRERTALRAFVAATSVRLFTQKATSVSQVDVLSLPYPESRSLALSPHEQILVADIVDYYRDLIRLGEDSPAMREPGISALSAFNEVYLRQVNAVYRKNRLRALEAQTWPGVVCQPFVFGKGKVDWSGAEELRGKLDALLREKRGGGLTVTRIARIYDGAFIFLLKPNRLRYWLRSIALRDADETMADLWDQGF